jgi:hypothetical protein
MNAFDRFLTEAFPPKKPAAGGDKKPPVAGAPKSPIGGDKSGAPSLPPKKAGGKPGEPPTSDGTFERSGDDSVLAQMQMQAEKEREEQEAQAQVQRDAAESKEREKAKQIRAKAEEEVADALSDKYNDGTDEVTFYPELHSFADWSKNQENSETGDKEGKDEEEKEDGEEDPSVKKDKDDEDDDEEAVDDKASFKNSEDPPSKGKKVAKDSVKGDKENAGEKKNSKVKKE